MLQCIKDLRKAPKIIVKRQCGKTLGTIMIITLRISDHEHRLSTKKTHDI